MVLSKQLKKNALYVIIISNTYTILATSSSLNICLICALLITS
jgi:hypothetical protein